MICAEINEILIDYLNGDLTPNEKAIVESHLEICPACQKELEDLKDMLVCCQEPIHYEECYIEEFVLAVHTRIERQRKVKNIFRYLPLVIIPLGITAFLLMRRPRVEPVPVYLDNETRIMLDSLTDHEFDILLDRMRQVSLTEE